jgi:hypothetical protein
MRDNFQHPPGSGRLRPFIASSGSARVLERSVEFRGARFPGVRTSVQGRLVTFVTRQGGRRLNPPGGRNQGVARVNLTVKITYDARSIALIPRLGRSLLNPAGPGLMQVFAWALVS